MKLDINALRKDGDLAEQGTWVEFEGARFKIRSSDSKAYRNIVSSLAKTRNVTKLKHHADSMFGFSLSALALGVLIDFEGVEDNGVPLAVTDENKLKICKIEVIREFLSEQAQNIANFQREAVAGDADALKSGGRVGPEVRKSEGVSD